MKARKADANLISVGKAWEKAVAKHDALKMRAATFLENSPARHSVDQECDEACEQVCELASEIERCTAFTPRGAQVKVAIAVHAMHLSIALQNDSDAMEHAGELALAAARAVEATHARP